MTDYYNLLLDSLRSSFLQIEKIYNTCLKAEYNQYVNVRTGYRMKYRKNDNDYIYSEAGIFPLCWNSEKISSVWDPLAVERLLKTYEKWILEYHKNKDNKQIEKLVNEEIILAKTEYKNEKKNNLKSNIKNRHVSHDEYINDSFLVKDDEDNMSNRKIIKFKKSLGTSSKKKKSNEKILNYDEELRDEFSLSEYLDEDFLKTNKQTGNCINDSFSFLSLHDIENNINSNDKNVTKFKKKYLRHLPNKNDYYELLSEEYSLTHSQNMDFSKTKRLNKNSYVNDSFLVEDYEDLEDIAIDKDINEFNRSFEVDYNKKTSIKVIDDNEEKIIQDEPSLIQSKITDFLKIKRLRKNGQKIRQRDNSKLEDDLNNEINLNEYKRYISD